MILGGSKPRYIEANMANIAKGPLPVDVVEEMEKVWKSVESVAPAF